MSVNMKSQHYITFRAEYLMEITEPVPSEIEKQLGNRLILRTIRRRQGASAGKSSASELFPHYAEIIIYLRFRNI